MEHTLRSWNAQDHQNLSSNSETRSRKYSLFWELPECHPHLLRFIPNTEADNSRISLSPRYLAVNEKKKSRDNHDISVWISLDGPLDCEQDTTFPKKIGCRNDKYEQMRIEINYTIS